MLLQDEMIFELSSGCGLVCHYSCTAARLGGYAILIDLPDRMKLLKENVEVKLRHDERGSAIFTKFIYEDDPDKQHIETLPHIDDIIQYFLDATMKDFSIRRVLIKLQTIQIIAVAMLFCTF